MIADVSPLVIGFCVGARLKQ